VIFGLALSFTGIHGFRKIMVPLLLLVFIIPLPGFIYEGLSSQLQLISSRIGVWIIRLFEISVYLEGNIIDLGNFKLQVVEACSGLRYLFPLMTLGFIAAYFFSAPFWMRLIVFLSTIPITVFMNSFRIGMIGVLVEYWGNAMAEGFLHDFEGWVIFMACTVVLMIEMWLLTRLSRERKPLREVFGIDLPEPIPKDAEVRYRTIPVPFLSALALLVLTGAAAAALPHRAEATLQRMELAEFPMKVGDWVGKQDSLEAIVIDALNFDDYLIANYSRGQSDYLNFYIGYYSIQRADKVPHSPRACIPGGGWAITSLTQQEIGGVVVDGVPLKINRLIIQKGDHKQLVYYWFQQRGRVLTSEYLTKWYLFWDALRLNRTDGALVRLTTSIPPGQDLDIAEARLNDFAGQVASLLNTYIPGKQ
jgi:exosortase D (VPLPA-CTERM-specific)